MGQKRRISCDPFDRILRKTLLQICSFSAVAAQKISIYLTKPFFAPPLTLQSTFRRMLSTTSWQIVEQSSSATQRKEARTSEEGRVVIIADGHQQSRAEETDKSHAVFISVGFGSDGHGLAPHEIPISSLNIGKVYSNKTAISNPSSLGEFFVSQVCTRPSGNIFRSSAYTGARVQNWDGMTITTFVQKSGIDQYLHLLKGNDG